MNLLNLRLAVLMGAVLMLLIAIPVAANWAERAEEVQAEAPTFSAQLDDQPAIKDAANDEHLPAILIKYDIPGAEASSQFVVEGPQGSVGSRVVGALKINDVENGQQLKIADLAPGNYEVTRYRILHVEGNDFGVSRFLERRQFQLRDQEMRTVEFTRPDGHAVEGKILGLQGKGIHKVVVNVCDGIVKDYESFRDSTIIDWLLCNDDGTFTTEPLVPGRYTIVAEAYLPLTQFQRASTGTIDPQYIAVTKFIVPENGKVPIVPVTLEDANEVWGNLNVHIVYDGTRPMNKRIAVTKDASIFGNEVTDESLVVGDKGELANVAIFVTDADMPIHPEERKRAEQPVELKVVGSQFVPRILPVMVPKEIKLTNQSPVAVNFHVAGRSNVGFNILVRANESLEAKLDKAEKMPLPVVCNIYPWMRAFVLPLNHPYAAATDDDGVASLMHLPEGEWTVRVWHENAGFLTSAETGEKDFKIRINEGENHLALRVTPEFAAQIDDSAAD